MIYIVDGDKVFDTATDAAQYIADNLDDDMFDDMMDEGCEAVEIFGLKYSPSIVLERVDPIAYRCAFSDWADSVYSDIKYDIERMDDGDADCFYGFEVEVREEEEEDE